MFTDNSITKDYINTKDQEYNLIDFGERVIRKAINKLDFYRFDNLQKYLPNLKSISEFINSENYLGKINLNVNGLATDVTNLSPQQKLEVAIEVLEGVSATIGSDKIEFKGSKEFKPYMIKDIITDKLLNFSSVISN